MQINNRRTIHRANRLAVSKDGLGSAAIARRAARNWAVRLAIGGTTLVAAAGNASAEQPAGHPAGQLAGQLTQPRQVRRLPPVARQPIETKSIVRGASFRRSVAADKFRTPPSRGPSREPTLGPSNTQTYSAPRPLPGGGADLTESRIGEAIADCRTAARVGADASVIASAWKAIEASVESAGRFDTRSNRDAAEDRDIRDALVRARVAIREAREFVAYNHDDDGAVARTARSHQTSSPAELDRRGIDRTVDAMAFYLDRARVHLSVLARNHPGAAAAMTLMADAVVRRDAVPAMTHPWALCLRRSSVAGRPDDAGSVSALVDHLQRVGLNAEADRVRTLLPAPRRSAMATRPSGAIVEQLSPTVFAQVSNDFIGYRNQAGGKVAPAIGTSITPITQAGYAPRGASVPQNFPAPRTPRTPQTTPTPPATTASTPSTASNGIPAHLRPGPRMSLKQWFGF